MPRTKEVFVDFYVVELPPSSLNLADSLKANFALSPEQRNFGVEDPLRLETLKVDVAGNVIGDFLRVRMSDLPNVAPLDGTAPSRPISHLGVTENEGIGRSTAFYYNETNKVLALQRNRSGASSNAIRQYIENLPPYDSPISLLPILQRDAYANLANWNRIRSIDVEVGKF